VRISRIFLGNSLATDTSISFDNESAHYVRNVLRLKKGDPITVFNGQGGEFSALLTLVSKKSVTANIGKWRPVETESALSIQLAVGISRGERMDFVIQKSVELGVSHICPLITKRTVVKLTPEKCEQKHLHWSKIAQNACEQCGRDRLPEISSPVGYTDFVSTGEGLRLFLDPRSEVKLSEVQNPQQEVVLLSGPEGGFSDQERKHALSCGYTGVRLGPRILRTETAVLAGIAILQAMWGDLG